MIYDISKRLHSILIQSYSDTCKKNIPDINYNLELPGPFHNESFVTGQIMDTIRSVGYEAGYDAVLAKIHADQEQCKVSNNKQKQEAYEQLEELVEKRRRTSFQHKASWLCVSQTTNASTDQVPAATIEASEAPEAPEAPAAPEAPEAPTVEASACTRPKKKKVSKFTAELLTLSKKN
jgi:hypothetical protein